MNTKLFNTDMIQSIASESSHSMTDPKFLGFVVFFIGLAVFFWKTRSVGAKNKEMGIILSSIAAFLCLIAALVLVSITFGWELD